MVRRLAACRRAPFVIAHFPCVDIRVHPWRRTRAGVGAPYHCWLGVPVFRVKLSDFGAVSTKDDFACWRASGRPASGRSCVKSYAPVSETGWDVRPFHGFAIASVNKWLTAARFRARLTRACSHRTAAPRPDSVPGDLCCRSRLLWRWLGWTRLWFWRRHRVRSVAVDHSGRRNGERRKDECFLDHHL